MIAALIGTDRHIRIPAVVPAGETNPPAFPLVRFFLLNPRSFPYNNMS